MYLLDFDLLIFTIFLDISLMKKDQVNSLALDQRQQKSVLNQSSKQQTVQQKLVQQQIHHSPVHNSTVHSQTVRPKQAHVCLDCKRCSNFSLIFYLF